MPKTKKQGDRPGRYKMEFFRTVCSQIGKPGYDTGEKAQHMFENIVQRIEWLEKEVDALKLTKDS